MENAQVMAQPIIKAAIETMKAAVQTMTSAAGPIGRSNRSAVAASTKSSGPSFKQPVFNWKD